MTDPHTIEPTQDELRELLIIKLRALARQLEGDNLGKRYPGSGEVRQAVARMRDIAGALL